MLWIRSKGGLGKNRNIKNKTVTGNNGLYMVPRYEHILRLFRMTLYMSTVAHSYYRIYKVGVNP